VVVELARELACPQCGEPFELSARNVHLHRTLGAEDARLGQCSGMTPSVKGRSAGRPFKVKLC
jgi:hypothetical protein